jgi:hypothetical protein
MTSSFSYVQNLPEAIGTTITRVGEEYTARHRFQWEPWYHGLLIWIIREVNSRVNKVQIDVVQYDGLPVVSFTPDAYEDEDESQQGMRRIKRKSAVEAEILANRQLIEFRDLLAPRSETRPGAASQNAFEIVMGAIEASLMRARSLLLSDQPTFVGYRTPFTP